MIPRKLDFVLGWESSSSLGSAALQNKTAFSLLLLLFSVTRVEMDVWTGGGTGTGDIFVLLLLMPVPSDGPKIMMKLNGWLVGLTTSQ